MSLCRRLSHECMSGASSFTTDNKTFHVFLSFRGPDTRDGFVSQLYSALEAAGVSTFLDEKCLPKGEHIPESLLQGIRASRICIPVFSKGFAQSVWCLKEVLHMVKLKANIWPLFYDVLPSPDVRYPEKGIFAEDFKKHEERLTPDLIEECKSALRDVSHLCGWSRNQFRSDADLRRVVLRDVMKRLGIQSPVYLHTPKCFGLEWPLESVKRLLRVDDPQKKMVKVGIHGMPGIGKTTLAKIVYKEICSQFDAACFVLDVRQRLTQDANGLAKLQQQVLHDLLDLGCEVDHVDRGRSLIEDRLIGRNVLLFLDDIESHDQLEALGGNYTHFGVGSRLLFTSRNLQILKEAKGDETYEVCKLQHKHALDLFNFHAMSSSFCEDQEFQTISNRIVNACEGHPLTLEAVGRKLQGERDKNVWTDMVEKLWRDPTIEGKLKACYDTLDSHEKELFQDIACFFLWMDKETAIIFWKELRLSPHASIRHLFQKSCISFGPHHELLMHSSWQALGRSLAKGKRLFSEVDVQQVFYGPKEKAAEVRYLSYEPKKKKTLNVKKFKSMRNLQLLWLTDVVIKGQFSEACFHDLRWLRWRRCSSRCLPPGMNLSRLAILQLTDGHLTHIWDERSQDYLDLLPEELKAMILSGCVFLESLPASLTYTHLQILDLENCKSIRNLPNSVGNFKSLVSLNMKGCGVSILPNDFGDLSSLKKLNLSECDHLCELPSSFGNLTLLQELQIHHNPLITKLPESFGGLKALELLNLSWCDHLCELPSSFGDLTLLKELQIHHNPMLTKLPESFGGLKALELLNLSWCDHLCELPSSFGNLTLLKELQIHHNPMLTKLPESFGGLKALELLNLSWCDHLCELPSSFGDLTLLKELQIHHNPMLTKLPESFGGLKALELLNLSWCDHLCELPSSFGDLTLLKELQIHHNPMLTKLPESFGGLKALELLNLSWCDHLCELPSSFGNLTLLQELHIHHNPMLTKLPDSFGGLKAVEFLNASYCRLSEDGLPPGIFELYQLKIMHLEHNKLRRLHEALKHLSQLLELHLDGCKELFQLPALPPSLKLLYIRDCTSLHRLCSLSELTSLRRLDARNSHLLQDLPGLESLQSLTRLDLRGCPNISYATLGNCLTGLQSLETLFIGGPGVSAMQLQSFYDSIQKLSFHEGCLVHPSEILSSKWRTAEARGMHGDEILCMDCTLDDRLSYCAGYIACILVNGQAFPKNEYCEPSVEGKDGEMDYNCKYLDPTNRSRYTIERDAESFPCQLRHPKTTTGGDVLELSVVRVEGDPDFDENEWLRTGSKLRVKAASDYENWKACFKFLTYEPPLNLIPPGDLAPKSAISITFGV